MTTADGEATAKGPTVVAKEADDDDDDTPSPGRRSTTIPIRPDGGSPQLDGLSNDISSWLLSHLSIHDIASVSLVSQRLHRACRSNTLWKIKFEDRWNIDNVFRVTVSGQSWYCAYQAAYNNPQDLWMFHWNCTFPQDGLVPGRCCIYDVPKIVAKKDGKSTNNLCPPCRFFPDHPLDILKRSLAQNTQVEKEETDTQALTEIISQATDKTLRDLAKNTENNKERPGENPPYSAQRATEAFSQAATFHRTLNTQQYTAAPPRQESDTTTCLAPLTDLLFFNVTEEPLSTKLGQEELQHLREERNLQQDWEQSIHARDHRRNPLQEFSKPAYETAHHTWHQAVVTNPDFVRPIVFRISVARPDCFVVFPSEGFLEAGQSAVVTFGVRPLGSLIATAFETINAQRHGNVDPDWLPEFYDEEGPLPCAPFCVRYKYSSVIPCIPARGFLSPHQPQPRHEDATPAVPPPTTATADAPSHPSVADLCWKQKQMIDYHWVGATAATNQATAPAAAGNGEDQASACEVEAHEVRSIYLSAHVNGHYTFAQFSHETLTPFDLTVDPSPSLRGQKQPPQDSQSTEHLQAFPMLFFAAPQLFEFYPNTVYPQLQQVQLETEVSHAGHVFRSHRRKCQRCRRCTWGPRMEEMGQAFVLARIEAWLSNEKQATILKNCATIVESLHEEYQRQEIGQEQQSETDAALYQHAVAVRRQQLLYTVQRMILRYRAAANVGIFPRLRPILTRLEILADCLYGINGHQTIMASSDGELEEEQRPWRMSGSYRYATCTASVFRPDQPLTMDHPRWNELLRDEGEGTDSFRYLVHTPGKYDLGPQEDPNHLGELVPPTPLHDSSLNQRQRGYATDMFMDDPLRGLQSALITIRNPRSMLVHGIYDRVPYPGKVVRRPKLPWLIDRTTETGNIANSQSLLKRAAFYRLQDALDLTHLTPTPTSDLSFDETFSMRGYLRNIPPMGMGRFPLSIDDGSLPPDRHDDKPETLLSKEKEEPEAVADTDSVPETATNRIEMPASIRPFAGSRIISLPLPVPTAGTVSTDDGPSLDNSSLQRETRRTGNPLRGEPEPARANEADNANNINFGGFGNGGPPLPLLRGPRLLNLLWAISAQLGWAVDDGSQVATEVVVNRHLLISLRWLSLTLMAAPLFWTLCARAAHWVPCKPVDYHLEDLPYELPSEMRFLTEMECAVVAFALVMILLYLGRWSERWTSRDFMRAMLEHVTQPLHSTFFDRLMLRYKRRWDEICPLFIQRMTFIPQWNERSTNNLMKHIAFWRSHDYREHRSVFQATGGRGLMFWGGRWGEIEIEDHSSRKLFLAAIGALGSFSSTTPHFWMNLLTVFSCSISLGISMSLHCLEKGVTGGAWGSVGAVLKSLNLVTLVSLLFLLGQLLGSSGGVLFLAEFVVTSISFILGGAGTISASSVESWGCFFCLSTTAFWGYLFGRVALMDGVIRQKRLVRSSLFSTTLLCASLAVVLVLWVLMSFWKWNVPASLMILRPNMAKTARGAGRASATAASGGVARSASAEYAAKHLQ